MSKKTMSALALLALLGGCIPALVATGGTTAGVVASQERSVGHAVDDAGIRLSLNDLFIHQDVKDLFRNVDINVSEGRVLLTGNVDNPDTAVEAVKLAWKPQGVKEVINEIQINNPSNFTSLAQDMWIATQIRTKLLLEKYVRSVNYNVEVVNGVVYIMGIAQDAAELEKVSYLASTTSYVKQVVSHVVMKDDPRRRGT